VTVCLTKPLRLPKLAYLQHCALLDDNKISGKSSGEECSEDDGCIKLMLLEAHSINYSGDKDDIGTCDEHVMVSGVSKIYEFFHCRILEHSVPYMEHFMHL
jgi:hypothetical protein